MAKKKSYILLDLFSGVGGFHLGLSRAGFNFKKVYFSENDKHAIANYKYNYKNSEYVGPVESIPKIERPHIITFGSPCQDFSIAGKGKGLKGDKSSLIEYPIRLIAKYKPYVFIWENVKGAFSSNNGADFWAIIQAFANIGGYRLEWQLLNTSWVLPQNRERIYLVGHLDGFSRSGVFPFSESDKEFSQKSRHFTESEIASCLQSPENACGNYKGMNIIQKTGGYHTTIKQDITGTLQAGGANVMDKVPNILCNDYKAPQSNRIYEENGISPTLAGGSKLTGDVTPKISISQKARGKNNGGEKEICPTISCNSFQDNNHVKVKPVRWQRTEKGKKARQENQKKGKDYTPFSDGHRELVETDEQVVGCITNAINKDCLISDELFVRRLTEIECERLQGFPDNWTQYGIYEKMVWINKKEKTFKIIDGVEKVPKTQRYKQMGNAVSSDIVEMVGKRILERCIK